MRHNNAVSLASFAVLAATITGCGADAGALDEATGTTASAVMMCGQTALTGIDVYHGDNGGAAIDWNAVKSGGASFAFAKATESTNFNDPMFATNWSGMKAAGLVRGAYHFFDPAADPTAQANFFLAGVGPVSAGDLLVLDFETTGGLSDSALSSAAATFLSTVQTATGLTPMLYASSAFLSNWGSLGVYPLWVANYGVTCPDVPSAWTAYTFWQSSGSGSAPGINGQVDVDSFNGTLEQLQALGGTSPGDAGTNVPDTGADTSTPATDSGPGNVDSGPGTVTDSGTSGTDSGTSPGDSGQVGATDSGTSAAGDAGHGTKAGDAGPNEYPNSSGKGCAFTVGDPAGSPGSTLAALAVVLVAARSRRRRHRGTVHAT